MADTKPRNNVSTNRSIFCLSAHKQKKKRIDKILNLYRIGKEGAIYQYHVSWSSWLWFPAFPPWSKKKKERLRKRMKIYLSFKTNYKLKGGGGGRQRRAALRVEWDLAGGVERFWTAVAYESRDITAFI